MSIFYPFLGWAKVFCPCSTENGACIYIYIYNFIPSPIKRC